MSLSGSESSKESTPQRLWIYERFEVGEHIGTSTQTVTKTVCNHWNSLYQDPRKEGSMPYGIAQLIVMRAYTDVVQPRPPGNIHATHLCQLTSVPSLAKELRAQVYCVGKYLKRERKMVDIRVSVSDVESGNSICDATLTICWSQ
jgi:hypothetical protein